jgi:Cobalamin-independent synthase, Catalytic domain
VLRDLPDRTVVLGVLDLGSGEAETPEVVAARIRRAFEVVPPERLVVAPDCGMKYFLRELRVPQASRYGRRSRARPRRARALSRVGRDYIDYVRSQG